jgi:hypothetical protein
MNNRIVWLLMMLATTACSSSPPPPAATSANAEPKSHEPAKDDGTTAESQREHFIERCLTNDAMKDYCECAFTQFVDVFRGVDLSKEVSDDDIRLARLGTQTKEKCADKIPESVAKEQFVGACTSKEPKKEPYCSCSWGELRKSLSVAEIIGLQPEDAKWLEAKKQLPKGCKGKYPAELAANEFIGACMQKDATEARCQCLWKKVSKAMTIEEIAAETRDVSEVPGLDTCK